MIAVVFEGLQLKLLSVLALFLLSNFHIVIVPHAEVVFDLFGECCKVRGLHTALGSSFECRFHLIADGVAEVFVSNLVRVSLYFLRLSVGAIQ